MYSGLFHHSQPGIPASPNRSLCKPPTPDASLAFLPMGRDQDSHLETYFHRVVVAATPLLCWLVHLPTLTYGPAGGGGVGLCARAPSVSTWLTARVSSEL